MKKVLFVDRDGTLIWEPPDGKIDSIEKLRPFPLVFESLKKLQQNEYSLVMISNQPGLGSSGFPRESFEIPHRKLMDLFHEAGVRFDGVYFCQHEKEDDCDCRKPKTGLLDSFLKNNPTDLRKSYVIGDRETDIRLAKNIDCKSIFYSSQNNPEADFSSDNWEKITEWILRRQ